MPTLDDLNGSRHRLALNLFLFFVLAHWAEHAVQAIQVWALDTPRPKALGALGGVWPGLVRTESLHYFYAVGMVVGLVALRRGFRGPGRGWWTAALAIQIWHLVEHTFLLVQFLTGWHFLGRPVVTSFLQVFYPRMELHLFYNAVVTIPMVVAMVLHARQRGRVTVDTCSCVRRHAAVRTRPATA
jgi:hypothetical protein